MVRWRQTANDELAEFVRSCLRAGHAVCTSEHEDAVLRNFWDTWDGISLRVCAKCVVVPIMSVGLVKYFLICLQFLFRVRVNLITEREDHAQIIKLALSDRILEDCQTVAVCNIWSRFLLENEDG